MQEKGLNCEMKSHNTFFIFNSMAETSLYNWALMLPTASVPSKIWFIWYSLIETKTKIYINGF